MNKDVYNSKIVLDSRLHRSEIHKDIETSKYQLFVADVIHFLLEETQLSMLRGEISPDLNAAIYALDMQQEYIRYGTYHPNKLDLDTALKMVGHACEHYGITMEKVNGSKYDYEYGFMVPASLIEDEKEYDTDLIKGFSK